MSTRDPDTEAGWTSWTACVRTAVKDMEAHAASFGLKCAWEGTQSNDTWDDRWIRAEHGEVVVFLPRLTGEGIPGLCNVEREEGEILDLTGRRTEIPGVKKLVNIEESDPIREKLLPGISEKYHTLRQSFLQVRRLRPSLDPVLQYLSLTQLASVFPAQVMGDFIELCLSEDLLVDCVLLKKLELLFEEKRETPLGEEYDTYLRGLSFTGASVPQEAAHGAWTSFVAQKYGGGYCHPLGWPLTLGIAEWYRQHDLRVHAISVYHDLRKQLELEPEEYPEGLAGCIETLADLYYEEGDYEQCKFHLLKLEEQYLDGQLGIEEYLRVMRELAELEQAVAGTDSEKNSQARRVGQLAMLSRELYQERNELSELLARPDLSEALRKADEAVKKRFGDLWDDLAPETKSYLRETELFSQASFVTDIPWVMPVSFHHALNKELAVKFVSHLPPSLKPQPAGQRSSVSCAIEVLEKRLSNTEAQREVTRSFREGRWLVSERKKHQEALEDIRHHRNCIEHPGKEEKYSASSATLLIEKRWKSDWLVRFLKAVQLPRRP